MCISRNQHIGEPSEYYQEIPKMPQVTLMRDSYINPHIQEKLTPDPSYFQGKKKEGKDVSHTHTHTQNFLILANSNCILTSEPV